MDGISGHLKEQKLGAKYVLKSGLILWPSFSSVIGSAHGMKDLYAVSAVTAVSAKLSLQTQVCCLGYF